LIVFPAEVTVEDTSANRAELTLDSAFQREDAIGDPLFILAAPRSFSSVICAMLGQHPQMHGLPETNLFSDETIRGWWGWEQRSPGGYPMDGLLRAIAQLCYKEQTETTVKLALGWLRRRSSWTSGMIFEELAREMYPLIPVEKSPSIVYDIESMRRAYSCFPHARFIHLVRHPRGHGESVLKYLYELAKVGPIPQWVPELAAFRYTSTHNESDSHDSDIDPQRGWYVLNLNIVTFLKSVPNHQWIIIRGEEVLMETGRVLNEVAGWLRLRTDREAINEMKHPERSPYACRGPRGARYGNDVLFLRNPAVRVGRAEVHSLDGAVSWRKDGQGFLPEVKELAKSLGYR
jgi:hypothetical protein